MNGNESGAAATVADGSPSLRFKYDPALPITAHRQEIADALAAQQVVVICGATGSGKTTQLPKLCLELGLARRGLIGHTQPRRIAARAIAARLAAELGTALGHSVGFQIRFTDRTGPSTRIKVMTDGILLKELERDRLLRRYDVLIIDEAHERSLNIDFLLGVLKGILPRRPDLKLVITSATIDPQRFAAFFGNAPVIEVSGRSYPVEIRYRPLQGDEDDAEATVLSLPEGVVAAVRELDADPRGRTGDILVFLPGEKQIRETTDTLEKARLPNTEILPLYARLSTQDQQRIFATHRQRRIVLATNVAETSLTVPGIRYVIDSGLARISRYSVRGKVQRLPIEPISQASADQRSGRCGREAEGIAIRLYSREDHELREPFTPAEVLRTNLASVILQMATLGLGMPDDFPFLDPPDTRLINDGFRLLQELKAVDDNRRVTSLGRQIATLPLDPRLARMLLAASHHACLQEMLIVVAFLSAQDPRERPADAQQQADAAHAQFVEPRSDFMTVLKLWGVFAERAADLSGSQLRKWCREQFVSFVRMREWQELHAQLVAAVEELKLRANQTPASYADLHQAVLTGFLGSIGTLDERREYLGARGTRFVIAPGTALGNRSPQWVVAGSLIETTRLYARMVATIEPGWIEAAGAHLLKRSYSEPHWVEDRGYVAAFETVTLYGLTLSSRRRVNFGHVAPGVARTIFVREALVEGHSRIRATFLAANAQLQAEIENLEARVRRRDILVDEDARCQFYLERLPENVHSVAAFEKWWRDSEAEQPRLLHMQRGDLMRREAPDAGEQWFPAVLHIAGNELPLEYRFEPTEPDDGVTLVIPVPVLPRIQQGELGWLVPGLLGEKIEALFRALPKPIRRLLVPVPDHAALCAAAIQPQRGTGRDFYACVAAWVTERTGQSVTADDVAALPLPMHLKFNVRLTDLEGRVLAKGRDLRTLRRQVQQRSAGTSAATAEVSQETALARTWEFGDLPDIREVSQGPLRFSVYPAIEDRQQGVKVVDAENRDRAREITRRGVMRLIALALPQQYKYARDRFAGHRELVLLSSGLPLSRPLADQLTERTLYDAFLEEEPPRSRQAFAQRIQDCKDRWGATVDETERDALAVVRELRTVRQKLDEKRRGPTGALKAALDDIDRQLAALMPERFWSDLPKARFQSLARYLKAIARRLDRLPAGVQRDAELMRTLMSFLGEWQKLAAQPHPQGRPELDQLAFMIEEFRVSLFAQDLKTAVSVSAKRLSDQLAKARAEAARDR